LISNGEWLRINPDIEIIIEGHCDERGTNEYNLALGDRRAESVKVFLLDLGINNSRLKTISYGEERPADSEHTETAWAKNRRAHFLIE
jgi:peptidoglycan-associated lipoprotein